MEPGHKRGPCSSFPRVQMMFQHFATNKLKQKKRKVCDRPDSNLVVEIWRGLRRASPICYGIDSKRSTLRFSLPGLQPQNAAPHFSTEF
ncbi:hypothetical protein ACFX11_013682 [Malus domestica]